MDQEEYKQIEGIYVFPPTPLQEDEITNRMRAYYDKMDAVYPEDSTTMKQIINDEFEDWDDVQAQVYERETALGCVPDWIDEFDSNFPIPAALDSEDEMRVKQYLFHRILTGAMDTLTNTQICSQYKYYQPPESKPNEENRIKALG